MDSAQNNKSIIRNLLDEVDRGNLAIVDECYAPSYTDHNPIAIPGLPTGLNGVKQAFRVLQSAFPDTSHVIEDIVAEGDKVVARISARGTHKGDLFGLAATGKGISMSSIAIYRMAGGKIVERWSEQSTSIMQQLGIPQTSGYSKPNQID